MPISLFEHNRQAYEAAFSLMQKTGKAAVIHPTGTGKSFIAFKLAEAHPECKICWFSPSEYIFRTQMENLKAASLGDAPDNISFCTYKRLAGFDSLEIESIAPDFIILDEFHRCGAAEWSKGIAALLRAFPATPVLGLSATHVRYLDSQRNMADELFDGNVASEMTLGEAIVRDILPPPHYVISVYSYQKEVERYQQRLDVIRSDGIRAKNQRHLEALRRALEKADGLDVVFQKHLTEKAGKCIVFCANVEHLEEMIEYVPDWFGGVDPEPHVFVAHAREPRASKNFQDFKNDNSAHLKLLFCIDMLNEGVHVEDVSGVILFRPTVSPIIYKQQIGRALSANKHKRPVILDIVNNFDGLCSISGIQEEMRTAIAQCRRHGKRDCIINDHFQISDEVNDCRRLFEDLQKSLSATWEVNYAAAAAFYQTNGHLEVPASYKTDDRLSLGTWVSLQRRVRTGTAKGNLSEEQITLLDDIGMRWDNFYDTNWERYLGEATAYYEANGNLDVPYNHVTDSGFGLGQWLRALRRRRKNGMSGYTVLNVERIAQLNAIGMQWDKFQARWEKNYDAACRFYTEHGHLYVLDKYIDESGFRLGAWLSMIRKARRSVENKHIVTQTQIDRLDRIGMIWGNKIESMWDAKYEAAKKYYLAHGHLDIPLSYETADGMMLGKWIRSQRKAKVKKDVRLTPERIKRLNEIGMRWGVDFEDPWERQYAVAQAYYKAHGHLDMPTTYVTQDGIRLGRWIVRQRGYYHDSEDGRPLTASQIRRLDAIGMRWKWKKNRRGSQKQTSQAPLKPEETHGSRYMTQT